MSETKPDIAAALAELRRDTADSYYSHEEDRVLLLALLDVVEAARSLKEERWLCAQGVLDHPDCPGYKMNAALAALARAVLPPRQGKP